MTGLLFWFIAVGIGLVVWWYEWAYSRRHNFVHVRLHHWHYWLAPHKRWVAWQFRQRLQYRREIPEWLYLEAAFVVRSVLIDGIEHNLLQAIELRKAPPGRDYRRLLED